MRQWAPDSASRDGKQEETASSDGDPRLRAALQRRLIQRKASGAPAKAAQVPTGAGSALGTEVRSRMEPRLGADLSQVRVHTGAESAHAATDLGARAFTVGSDVHFQSGEFAPGTREGDRLLAHELTHVIQGDKSGVHRKEAEGAEARADEAHAGEAKDGEAAPGAEGGAEAKVSQPGDPDEKKADEKADQVTDQLHGAGDEPQRIEDDPDWAEIQEKIAQQEAQEAEGGAKEGGPQDTKQGDTPDPKRDEDKTGEKKEPDDMTGIGATVSVNRFVAAAEQVQEYWSVTSPQERADRLAKAANEELANAQVTPTVPKLEDLGTSAGQFHFRTWIMGLGQVPFSQSSVTDEEAADMADTVYHESRHAEQWHRMARLLAGQGKKADEIQKQTEMPSSVCSDAAGKPLDASKKEGAEAQGFFDSVYGKDSAKRMQVFRDLKAKGDARVQGQKDYEDIKKDPSAKPEDVTAAKEKWRAAFAAYLQAHAAYKQLPEEKDAFNVGDKVTAKYLGTK